MRNNDGPGRFDLPAIPLERTGIHDDWLAGLLPKFDDRLSDQVGDAAYRVRRHGVRLAGSASSPGSRRGHRRYPFLAAVPDPVGFHRRIQAALLVGQSGQEPLPDSAGVGHRRFASPQAEAVTIDSCLCEAMRAGTRS